MPFTLNILLISFFSLFSSISNLLIWKNDFLNNFFFLKCGFIWSVVLDLYNFESSSTVWCAFICFIIFHFPSKGVFLQILLCGGFGWEIFNHVNMIMLSLDWIW